MSPAPAVFRPLLTRWDLTPDGPPIHTHSSDLLPVRFRGEPAMLKIARIDEEELGHRWLVWRGGVGAARTYAHDGAALLLERLLSRPSLTALVHAGHDDEATRQLCGVAARIHAPSPHPAPELPPLAGWFRALTDAADRNGTLRAAWATAQGLLRDQREVLPLHGDLHHANALHSPERGWLAIDPKGLIGERTFDFANLLCNPDLEVATRPGRLARQVALIADLAGLERARLLRWVVAYAGLSAAWWLEDEEEGQAAQVLEVARLALAELG